MKVTNIAHAAQEAERFLAAVKLWRAKKLLALSEEERVRVASSFSTHSSICGAEHAAVRRASLDLSKALSRMRQDI